MFESDIWVLSPFLTKTPLDNRMHYSLLPGMLLLDKYGRNKLERLEGWKSKSSEETRSECQDREEREIERGNRGKRGDGR